MSTLKKCVVFPKQGKCIAGALKAIHYAVRYALLYVDTAPQRLRIETLSDNRCCYYQLSVGGEDIQVQSEADIVFGLEMKQLVFALRDITTLSDVIQLEFSANDEMTAECRTKKTEARTLIKGSSVDDKRLDVKPKGMQCNIRLDIAVKDMEEVLKNAFKNPDDTVLLRVCSKGLSVMNKNKTDVVKMFNGIGALKTFDQEYKAAELMDIFKSTLSKKVTVTMHDAYPMSVTHHLTKSSTFTIWIGPIE